MRAALLLVLVAIGLAAPGSTGDERGWSEGTPALNGARYLAGPEEPPEVSLPEAVAARVEGPTLLVYFSPTCPHCQHAQPELNALSKNLEGKATVLGVASGSATEGSVLAYRIEYNVPYEVIVDADRDVAAAMGVRGTPSALLVREHRGAVVALDAWYPYQPGHAALVELRVSDDPWAGFRPGEYLGNHACATCHPQEMDSWQLTHHSVAWATLEKGGHTGDVECTSCHVTGAGERTGWSGDPDSKLVDVGCEACHGPGGPHDGARTDASTTCAGCHDDKHSIAFSYEKGLPHIDHFAANAMDDSGWRERRRELLDGSAPRELLAFPDGAHVGAGACKECHAEAYAHWADSPHARAMATLSTDKVAEHFADAANDVECVKCHATADSAGPPPTSLDRYRLDESVGCESCHGPGERHVAAEGGTDNIEALGENCPVCVLEAICTRCHTREWDPLWRLETRVDAIRHGNRPTD